MVSLYFTYNNFLKIHIDLIFSHQILSRVKGSDLMSSTSLAGAAKHVPSFEELMMKRDYIGARTLLEVSRF